MLNEDVATKDTFVFGGGKLVPVLPGLWFYTLFKKKASATTSWPPCFGRRFLPFRVVLLCMWASVDGKPTEFDDAIAVAASSGLHAGVNLALHATPNGGK